MKILITGAASALGREIAAALNETNQVRRLDDCGPIDECGEWIEASLVDVQAMVEAVRDIDVVIHTGQPPPALPADVLLYEEMLLDLATRGTHVLCQAAVEAGVKRLVYGSTLEVFGDYPDTVFVTEHYKPLPTTEPRVLAQYLGEVVCREFARDYAFTATALRLGRLVWEEDLVGGKLDLLWLDIRDAASAFVQAIERDDSDSLNWVVRWAVYHICAPVPNAKFLIGRAEGMGYAPKRDLQVGAR